MVFRHKGVQIHKVVDLLNNIRLQILCIRSLVYLIYCNRLCPYLHLKVFFLISREFFFDFLVGFNGLFVLNREKFLGCLIDRERIFRFFSWFWENFKVFWLISSFFWLILREFLGFFCWFRENFSVFLLISSEFFGFFVDSERSFWFLGAQLEFSKTIRWHTPK